MIKIFKKSNYIFFLIILFGFVLRIVSLNTNPPSMHADEADTGYTALSLIQTGMDPYGNSWPLHFQDQASNFKAPLYTYSVIPFVLFLGLNPVAERLPSVIFGILLIVSLYYLLRQYFTEKSIPLVGAFLVAINPWSIHLSRTGLEVQLSVLLTTAGILFFELSKKKSYFIILSFILFTLSLFSYHPAKIFTPLILIVLFMFNFSYIKKIKKYIGISLSIFLFGIIVLGYLAVFGKGASHFNDVSILDNSRAKIVVDSQRNQTTAPLNVSGIFSNKPIYFLRQFTNMYVGPLSISYLFINGENNLDKGIGNYGQYHLFELIPFIIGGFALWKRKKKIFLFVLIWFLIGLIPAGITRSGNYAYRDVNALIPPIILTSVGISVGFKYLYTQKRKFVLWLYVVMSFGFFTFFLYNYYFSYPVYSRDWWGYSQKEVLEYAVQNKDKYRSVVIDGGLDWAILYAFYYKTKPKVFQKAFDDATMVKGRLVIKIDGIYFGPVINESTKIDNVPFIASNSLLIAPSMYFKDQKALRYFYAVDGGTNLKAYEIKN
ncbi:MAG: glycosyltransferase family 39 protein [Candidatus Levybacteria bacterium]|nr:glycosyltransferase family 39 protein [Candidatus Levybacteria bacterium]